MGHHHQETRQQAPVTVPSWEHAGCHRHYENWEQGPIAVPTAQKAQGPRPLQGDQEGLIAVPATAEAHGPPHLHTPYQGDNVQHTLRKEAASIQTESNPSKPDKMAE